jgi:hypothetical protein
MKMLTCSGGGGGGDALRCFRSFVLSYKVAGEKGAGLLFYYLKMKGKRGYLSFRGAFNRPVLCVFSTLISGRPGSEIAGLMLLYIPSQLNTDRCGVYVTLAQG